MFLDIRILLKKNERDDVPMFIGRHFVIVLWVSLRVIEMQSRYAVVEHKWSCDIHLGSNSCRR